MEIHDSTNHVLFSENPLSKIINYDDHDADLSFEEKLLKTVIMRSNISMGKDFVFSSEKPSYEKKNNVIKLKDFIRNMGGSEPELSSLPDQMSPRTMVPPFK